MKITCRGALILLSNIAVFVKQGICQTRKTCFTCSKASQDDSDRSKGRKDEEKEVKRTLGFELSVSAARFPSGREARFAQPYNLST